LELGLVDEIIPEPLGGAHSAPEDAAQSLKSVLLRHLENLLSLPADERLKSRYDKFRAFGHFVERKDGEDVETPKAAVQQGMDAGQDAAASQNLPGHGGKISISS
jgi:hypothetical protein